ncbi:protein-disulfide reductase DsbD domain-containing protein [Beijerinckia indica]|uniref:protein-disulfide reductase DsbD domain-containing protein n=1 Tax=Beijerinckia indica TaxID=533 RepID=UPI0002DAB8B3|nr:protein-disulfide reductase DsbD domain-containing protein [Beijerinckia indica]
MIKGEAEQDGIYVIGIAIELAPDLMTYWRMPGEAGVAPVFSFDHSSNLAKTTVLYPAPERISDEGAEIFGYRGRVVFPIRVEPRDAHEQVTLSLALDYATCGKICRPQKAQTEVLLSPGKTSLANPRLTEALSEVPTTLTPEAVASAIKIMSEPGYDHPTWRLQWVNGHARDLFVEAPDGWYFETKPTGQPDEFLLRQILAPAGTGVEAPPPPLTLTLAGMDRHKSYEFSLQLPPIKPTQRKS